MNPKRALRIDLGHMTAKQAQASLREHATVIQHEVRRHKLRIRRRPWIDPDDLHAIAQAATLEAVTRYDATVSETMSVRGYVRRMIRQRLHDSIDSDYDTGDRIRVVEIHPDGTVREYWAAWVMASTVSLDQNVHTNSASPSDGHLTLADIVTSEDYDPDALDNLLSDRLLLRKILAKARLSVRHLQVLSALLNEQSEISLGRELGISKQKINVDKLEMLAILRRYAEPPKRLTPQALPARVLTAL